MKFFYSAIFFSLLPLLGFNQIDTLKEFEKFLTRLEKLSIEKNDSLEIIAQNAISWSRKHNYPQLELKTDKILSNYFYFINEREKSFTYLVSGIKLAEKNNLTFEQIELIYDLGLSYSRSARRGSEIIDSTKLYDAIEYFEQGIELSNKIKHKAKESQGYNLMAVCYERLNNSNKALEYYKTSETLSRNALDSVGLGYTLDYMGALLAKINRFEEAEKNLLEALEIRKRLNEPFAYAINLNNMGELYFSKSLNNKAIEYLEKSFEISFSGNYQDLALHTAGILSEIYEENKDFEKAFELKTKEQILKDSLYNFNRSKLLEELETKYETEKKDEEIAHQKEVIEKEKIINYFLYTLVTFLIIIAISFYLWHRAKQQQKLQRALLKEKEKNIESVIYAQEEERQRIAKDLHDGIIQQLTSLKFGLKKIFENKEDENSKKIFSQLEESTSELRNISHQMMPKALNDLGVVAAIEDMLNKSLNPLNINFNFETFGITERLKQNIEITLFRVCQELINNIIKHSKANQVSVQLFKSGNNIMLIVEDNGVGFNKSKSTDGIGMMNISSRLDTVSGKVNFEPSPNSGTLATVKIPLQ